MIEHLNASVDLRRKVGTPDGEGIILGYSNMFKTVKVEFENGKLKEYRYEHCELYEDNN